MSKLTYTESTVHGPEVDFGTGWSLNGEGYLRVTWVEYLDPAKGFTGRGDVCAFKSNEKVATLGRDIPLFVVEHVLSGVSGEDWATACIAHSDITWVEKRLAKFNGCEVVTYNGKERRMGAQKAARKYAEIWGYEARPGGWIYNRQGKAYTQGWDSFAHSLTSWRAIMPIRQEETGTDYRDRRYSETWVVSITRAPFGA